MTRRRLERRRRHRHRTWTAWFERTVTVEPAGIVAPPVVPPWPIEITVPAAAPSKPPVMILLNSPPLNTAPSTAPAAAPVAALRAVLLEPDEPFCTPTF